jgi:hypothetical protein
MSPKGDVHGTLCSLELFQMKKKNVSVCWLVILRHFISENIEIITSDKKERLPKSEYLFFPLCF